jgi:hypothetical protein
MRSNMHVKSKILYIRIIEAILILSFILCFSTSCCEKEKDDPPITDVTRTLILENAEHPVWLNEDEDAFLFTYNDGTIGLYKSDMYGNVTQLHDGIHNHDYRPSPDGTMVLFTTPELDGGLIVIGMDTGEQLNFVQDVQSGSWFGNSRIVLTNNDGQVGVFSINSPSEISIRIEEGYNPLGSSIGELIAYRFLTSSGYDLRIYDPIYRNPIQLCQRSGSIFCWLPDIDGLIAEQLRVEDNSISDIIKVRSVNSSDLLILEASTPSLSKNGIHLFANDNRSGYTNGIQYLNLSSGRDEFISNARRPAAANGTSALVEWDDSIYLISF